MKLLDIINEDFTPEQLKELKGAKTVFLFFKKGAVRFKNVYNEEEYIVKYELGESKFTWSPDYDKDKKTDNDFRISVKDLTVYITDQDLYDSIVTNPNRMQDVRGQLVYNYILPKIKNTFIRHKVRIYIVDPNINFILVQPEKSKEPEVINEEAIDKDIKKAKLLYKVFKTGVHRLDVPNGGLYKYILSDDYELTNYEDNGEKKILIEPISVDMYFEGWDNGVFKVLDKKEFPVIERWMIKVIRKKFAQHNVDIVII